jgi:hypothetical protein
VRGSGIWDSQGEGLIEGADLMARELLGVALWRWCAFAVGLASLAAAVFALQSGDPVLGRCLHAGAPAGLGHCPLCWLAGLAFLAAATPPLRTLQPRRATRV